MRSDDEQAFTRLYQLHWQKLYGISYQLLKDTQAAEDITQEVYVSFWKNRHQTVVQSPTHYLATAVKFLSLAYLRKHRKTIITASEGFADLPSKQHAETLLEEKILLQLLKEETNRLPEKCRLIFTFSREEGMSIAEIAERLNLSPSTVNNQLTKALGRLRKKLKVIPLFFASLL